MVVGNLFSNSLVLTLRIEFTTSSRSLLQVAEAEAATRTNIQFLPYNFLRKISAGEDEGTKVSTV